MAWITIIQFSLESVPTKFETSVGRQGKCALNAYIHVRCKVLNKTMPILSRPKKAWITIIQFSLDQTWVSPRLALDDRKNVHIIQYTLYEKQSSSYVQQ